MSPTSPVVLQRHGPAEVLAQRAEVMWPNGSAVGLHAIRLNGIDAFYLRAVHHTGHWIVFDLRLTSPELGPELGKLPRRDAAAAVFTSLRRHFSCAEEFLGAAVSHSRGSWRDPSADAPVPHPIYADLSRSPLACATA